MYYVYILKCNDGTYYTGFTKNLEKRLFEHSAGLDKNSYVYNRKPCVLVWNDVFTDVYYALQAEKQIKGWRRKKKEALINNRFDILNTLSRGKNGYMSLSKAENND